MSANTEARETTIKNASQAAFDDDANQIVGLHPVFGWVYRHNEDLGGQSELTDKVTVTSSGVLDA